MVSKVSFSSHSLLHFYLYFFDISHYYSTRWVLIVVLICICMIVTGVQNFPSTPCSSVCLLSRNIHLYLLPILNQIIWGVFYWIFEFPYTFVGTRLSILFYCLVYLFLCQYQIIFTAITLQHVLRSSSLRLFALFFFCSKWHWHLGVSSSSI
jgi:hypothetical protein